MSLEHIKFFTFECRSFSHTDPDKNGPVDKLCYDTVNLNFTAKLWGFKKDVLYKLVQL